MDRSWSRQFGFHVRRLLQEFDFVRDLEPSVAHRVADTVHRASGDTGEVCFREGDTPEYLYIVIAGYVEVWKDLAQEDGAEPLEARYDEGTIEAQMQCSIMETMLREREEAERIAQQEKMMEKMASSRASKKRRNVGANRLAKTDPDMLDPEAATRAAAGRSPEYGSPLHRPMSGRRYSSLSQEQVSEEDLLMFATRSTRRPSFELPEALITRRTRVVLQVPDSEEEMGHSPSTASCISVARQRSARHAATVDFPMREKDDPEGKGSRPQSMSLSIPKGPVKMRKGRRETVDQIMMAVPSSDQDSVPTVAAQVIAATRAPGPDETFGVHLATLGPGSIFGEMALLENSARTASVTCKGPCKFLLIGREDFERVLKSEIKKLKLQKLAGPVRHLLSSFKFYQELDDKVQKAVVDIVHYSSHPQGTVFYRQGDPPGSCYIVLSGTVSVWKNDLGEGTVEAVPSLSNNHPVGSKQSTSGVRTVAGSMQAASAISKAIVAKLCSTTYKFVGPGPQVVGEAPSAPEDYGTQVAVLSHGALFGELSLLEDRPRNNTAVCEEDCEIFIIQRAAFDAVLRSAINLDCNLIPKHAEAIVEQLPEFNVMRPVVRQNLPHIMKHHFESDGSVIWFSGDVLSHCYLLLSGEVSFWEETVAGDPFAPVDVEQGSEEVREKCAALAALLQRPEEANGPVLEEQRTQYDKSHGVYGFRSRVVQAGVLFGADALFDGKPVNSTCTCQRDCLFLVIAKSDFDAVLREEIRMDKMRKSVSQVRRVLMEFPIFRDLPQGVIDALPSLVHYRMEKAGSVLFNQGEPPTGCFIVLAGEATIWKLECHDEEKQLQLQLREESDAPTSPAERSLGRVRHAAGTPKASKEPKMVHRSPPISLAVRDMCGALSMMLADSCMELNNNGPGAVERDQLKQTALGRSKSFQIDTRHSWALGSPVAVSGPGSIVGERALITDKPRNATVTCEEDSEFLVIAKEDFDRLVKREMKRARDEKLEFLRKHVPNFKHLKETAADNSLYFFKHGTYPRNHRFFTKGDPSDGSIHIVWKGGVEVTHSNPRPSSRPNSRGDGRGGLGVATPERRLGLLLRGSCFGALPARSIAPYTAVSASCTCEVLSVSAENLASLPEVLQRSLRDQMDQVMARRSTTHEPMGSLVRSASKGALQARRKSVKEDEARPELAVSRQASLVISPPPAEAWTLPRVASCPSKMCAREPSCSYSEMPYPFSGLFKGEAPTNDFQEFDMMPGECLAMTGRVPMKRSKRLEATNLLSPASGLAASSTTATVASYLPMGSVLETLQPWNSRPCSVNGKSVAMPSRGHIGVGVRVF